MQRFAGRDSALLAPQPKHRQQQPRNSEAAQQERVSGPQVLLQEHIHMIYPDCTDSETRPSQNYKSRAQIWRKKLRT